MEKCNWIDADTIIVSACMAAQYNYMVYRNGEPIEPTKSKLQWTKDYPDKDPDDYVFIKEASLKNNTYGKPQIEICKDAVKAAIKSIEDKYPDYKAWVCIEGEGNYRKDIYPDYKASRGGEILLRKKLSRWVVDYFPRVKVSYGCETDDTVAKWQWKGYQDYRRTGVYTHMTTSCDKDAKTVAGKLYNPCKDVELLIDKLEADRWFCTQMLYGDSVDNIKGINGPISKELSIQLGVTPNSKGVGLARATKIMINAKTSRECFETLVRCYMDVHEKGWLDAMQEEAIALRMQHTEGEQYKILSHMLHLKVDLHNNLKGE